MSTAKAWIISLRLRTLPLALSTIFMGSILAAAQGHFKLEVLVFAALTTLFLQILSNLSNDYGDAVSGADNEMRVGPQRMIQSGIITLKEMKRAMTVSVVMSFISGVLLLYFAFDGFFWVQALFLLLGVGAILAAIRYTVGSSPYGYRGLGDVYVFVFFGLLGVAGTWFLHTSLWQWPVLLPAATIGFFSAGVLNLNNIRDIESDRQSRKITLVVRMGRRSASWYHLFLIAAGWLSILVFVVFYAPEWRIWPIFLSLPLFAKNVYTVFRNNQAHALDPELRNLALSTLLFVVLSATMLI
jgi:1,4-dihydroxy-2-naphthoate polyprenyltransferase